MSSITVGWVAACLVLLGFSLRIITSLRLIAVFSNLAFMAYSIQINSTPILVLHSLLLPLNLYRLAQLFCLKRNVQRTTPDSETLSLLLTFMRTISVREGEVLFSLGDNADEVFLILNGEINLVKANISLGEGQLLGLMGVFTQQAKRTDSAVCVTPVQLACITRENLRQAMLKEPTVSEMLLRTMAERAVKNNPQLSHGGAGNLMPSLIPLIFDNSIKRLRKESPVLMLSNVVSLEVA